MDNQRYSTPPRQDAKFWVQGYENWGPRLRKLTTPPMERENGSNRNVNACGEQKNLWDTPLLSHTITPRAVHHVLSRYIVIQSIFQRAFVYMVNLFTRAFPCPKRYVLTSQGFEPRSGYVCMHTLG
jgi:hypothetical protein